MSEKKEIKINLYVAVAIVFIIVFLIVGYYIFSISEKNIALQKEKEQMQDKVGKLENQVGEYQNKIDTAIKVISNEASNEKAEETNLENSSNISKTEAEKILKEKFDILEKLYYSADIFCNIDPNITEQGRLLTNFEKSLDEYFTENMKKTIKENLPLGVKKEDSEYYYSDWGGFLSFNGLAGFEDIIIKQDTIVASVITKQIDPDDKTLPNKTTSIKIVKTEDKWFIDSFDVARVFYGDIDSTENTTFMNEQVKGAFQKYLGLIAARETSPSTVLKELKLINQESNQTAKKEGYLKTDVKYSKFKETILKYITVNCLQKEFSVFIEEDGYLCYFNGGATGIRYEVNRITKVNDKKYKAEAIWSQEEVKENVSFEFGIENSNGHCVIDYCIQNK